MRFSHLTRSGRPLPLAIVLLALLCAAAHAGGVPPIDPPTIPFLTHVDVSRPDCIICPPRDCPDEPVRVT